MLKAGEQEAPKHNGQNPYTAIVDEAEGLDKLEQLQNHHNEDVYKKAMNILETYFGLDEDEDDGTLTPETTQAGFVFAPQPPPPAASGGFNFGTQ